VTSESTTRLHAGRAAPRGAPLWLQVLVIIGLLSAGILLALNSHVLWGTLLAIGGSSFGLSFILRRMIGDDYGRA
jgi:hypothetical protein